METLTFSTNINAPKEKVWEILWSNDTYGKWTNVFAEGSIAVTDWKEGSKVLFLSGCDGMVSKIAANKPYEFMSIAHQGIVKDGIEDTTSEAVQGWKGAMENYTLTEADGQTSLQVDMDTVEEYKGYFKEKWPLAIEQIKLLSEG